MGSRFSRWWVLNCVWALQYAHHCMGLNRGQIRDRFLTDFFRKKSKFMANLTSQITAYVTRREAEHALTAWSCADRVIELPLWNKSALPLASTCRPPHWPLYSIESSDMIGCWECRVFHDRWACGTPSSLTLESQCHQIYRLNDCLIPIVRSPHQK